jgi:UDP-GlcNAc:undecaprenyl-phosphate GlcNAc-1-phosphate transferase
MRPSAFAYGIVFASAFGTALVLTPLCGWLAKRLGAIDARTDDRRVHVAPTPYLGGVAMCLGILAGALVAWRMGEFQDVFEDGLRSPLNGVLLAAVIACAVGTWDDIREVSPPAKTAGLVLAGSALYWMGAALLLVRIPFFGTIVLSWDLAPLITVIWVMGMANATNFIDGLDGLAAGIVAIASGALFLYAHRISDITVGVLPPESPAPLIAIVVLGACVGFLPYNFNPARIFMGDGGALMLGVVMAGATMLVGGQTDTPVSGRAFFFYFPLIIPLVVMGAPILDTLWAIIRRTRKGLSPAHADKNHLHHRLMRMGHGHRRSVLILWTWTGLLSAFVLIPVYTDRGNAVVPIGLAAAGLVLYTYLHPGARRTREGDAV